MGYSSEVLAKLAYDMALNGIDLIKDDHGLSNQSYASFKERIQLVSEAVQKANKETGRRALYIPNVTAPFKEIYDRVNFAKENNVGGLMFAPGISGFDVMKEVAEDDNIGLPIVAHPALLGSYTINPNGISSYIMFGQLARLCGADISVFPNFAGRFPVSKEECQNIVKGCLEDFGHLKPVFPSPAGGINLEILNELNSVYGKEVVYLIGGGLFKYSKDLKQSCSYFKQLILDMK
jgi:ribulose-bisphosphate carboxylase large chain